MTQQLVKPLTKLEVSEYNRRLDRFFSKLSTTDIDRILKEYGKLHRKRVKIEIKAMQDTVQSDLINTIVQDIPSDIFNQFTKLQMVFLLQGYNGTSVKEFAEIIDTIKQKYESIKS